MAQKSTKPLQLLVGEGKNAKYIQGTKSLQISKVPSDCVLSFLCPLQPAQSCSWEDKVRIPHFAPPAMDVMNHVCCSNSVAVSEAQQRVPFIASFGWKNHGLLVQTLAA